ncbi:hypothetical protein SUGI_0573040 [Cryptomeria japonica]|nr:hypothetical protein SUGI_0573040 [Cryptomeria japonica]
MWLDKAEDVDARKPYIDRIKPHHFDLLHRFAARLRLKPWKYSTRGKDIIVGMIDTGIWPESKSFKDEGLGPVPA